VICRFIIIVLNCLYLVDVWLLECVVANLSMFACSKDCGKCFRVNFFVVSSVLVWGLSRFVLSLVVCDMGLSVCSLVSCVRLSVMMLVNFLWCVFRLLMIDVLLLNGTIVMWVLL